MDRAPLNFAFSSCPNDTFAFHALVHGLVPGPRVVPHIDDVEALNARAERGDAEVTKISIAAYGRIRDRYALLRAGGAAGFGVGPIVVAADPRTCRRPRRHSRRAHDRRAAAEPAGPLRDRADAVRSDRGSGAARRRRLRRADSRRAIHVPGQGTHAAGGSRRGVGRAHEVPAAAGGHRDSARSGRGSTDPRWTARFARASNMRSRIPMPAANTSREHAQEMDPRSPRKHIQLYVNDYTVALDERAVHALLDWQQEQGLGPVGRPAPPIFI